MLSRGVDKSGTLRLDGPLALHGVMLGGGDHVIGGRINTGTGGDCILDIDISTGSCLSPEALEVGKVTGQDFHMAAVNAGNLVFLGEVVPTDKARLTGTGVVSRETLPTLILERLGTGRVLGICHKRYSPFD
jgi:hypothetical protein